MCDNIADELLCVGGSERRKKHYLFKPNAVG